MVSEALLSAHHQSFIRPIIRAISSPSASQHQFIISPSSVYLQATQRVATPPAIQITPEAQESAAECA
eukprot:752216-Pelagomonas_calceolata.AAC.2